MTIDPDQRLQEAAKQLQLAREQLGGEAARRLRDAEATVRGVRQDPREVRCDGGEQGKYAGGQACDGCDRVVSAGARYCQWCGTKLREVLADGGLPSWAATMETLTGGRIVRCQTCGSEGETAADVDHREECPEAEDLDVYTDGGAIACDECGEELSPAEGVCLPAGRFCDSCKPEAMKSEGCR